MADAEKPKAEEGKFAELKAKLIEQALSIREELVKAAEKLKANPTVAKGIELYDSQVKMLHDAQNSETAQRVMDMLSKAKDAIVATIETVANMPLTKDILARLNDYQTRAAKTIADLQAPKTA